MPAKRSDKKIGRLDQNNVARLTAYMQETGVKHSKIAEMLGVSKVTLSHILSGRRNIFADQQKALIDLIGTEG